MIPLRMRLVNFMCYRETTVDLNGIHLACLTGDNGAGKSALLDALTWALWGKARAKREEELIRLGQTDMEVELEFALGNLRYDVIRKRSKRRSQTGLTFQVWSSSDQTWRDLSESALYATERRISQELHLDYDTFINSAFLVQGRADEFTTKPPAERKQVLGNILGLGIYDAYEERAKDLAKERESEARSLLAQMTQIDQELIHKPEYEESVRQATAATARASEFLQAAEAMQQALRTEKQALESQKAALDDLDSRLRRDDAELRQAEDEIRDHGRLLAVYEELVQQRKEIEAGYARLHEAREQNEKLNRKLRRHAELEGERNSQQRIMDQARFALEKDLRAAQDRQEPLKRTVAARPAHEQTLAHAGTELERLAQVEREYNDLRAQVQALAEARARLGQESRTAGERCQALRQTASARHTLETTLSQARAELEKLALHEREREEFRIQAQTLAEERARREAENKNLKGEGESRKEKIALLEEETGDALCPLCGQSLSPDDQHRLLTEFLAQLEQMRQAYSDNDVRIKQIAQQDIANKQRTTVLDKELAQQSHWQKKEGQTAESLKQAETAQAELQDWQRRVEEAARALAEVGQQETPIKQQMQERESSLTEHSRWQRLLGQAEEGLRLAADAEVELQSLQQREAEWSRILEGEAYATPARERLRQVEAALTQLAYDPVTHEQARQQMEDLSPYEQKHRDLQLALGQKEAERRAVEIGQARCNRLLATIAADGARREELQKAVARLPEVARRLVEQDRQVDALAEQEQRARERFARARQLVETCERLAQQRIEKEKAHLHAAEEQGLYEELRAAFGKKGLQAMIIETVTPQIEDEANRLLAQMTAGRMHVRLNTQRESRRGDTIETLDILISDEMGQRSYELYSGGEAFRVNFALRIALSKLLAHRAGTTLQTLIMDEGFGTQDAQGRERLVEAIHSIKGEFQCILVITHIDELKDLFPVRVEVTKGAEGSTVIVS